MTQTKIICNGVELWIDTVSGNLCIQNGSNSICTEIEFKDACEIVRFVENQLLIFKDKKEFENSSWTKKLLNGKL